MKAQNNAALAAPVEKPAPIVAVGEMAQVQQSGIENKNHVATDKQVADYAAQIRAGKPTGKIFPTKLSQMEFTDGQREVIRLARKAHRDECIASKKTLVKLIQAKDVLTPAHRQNAAGTRGSIGYVKLAAFNGKDGKVSKTKLDSFLAGPQPKKA